MHNRITRRFEVLDGLRGLSALLVAVFHFMGLTHLFVLSFFRNSWLFVDFFFVLSGFVITHAYGTRLQSGIDLLAFSIRRFGRIWPLHMAVLMPLVASEVLKLGFTAHGFVADRVAFQGRTSLEALAANVFLVQAMGFIPTVSWNGPSWSISVEYWAYAVYGIVVVAAFLLGWRRSIRTALFCVILATCALTLEAQTHVLLVVTPYGFERCLTGFIAGHLIYELNQKLEFQAHTATELLVLVLVLAFVSFAGDGPLSFYAPLVFGMVVLIFSRQSGGLSKLLSQRAFQWLGKVSFSIYMIHWVLLDLLFKLIALVESYTGQSLRTFMYFEEGGKLVSNRVLTWGGPYFCDGVLIVFIVVVLAASQFTYRWIERPGQKLFERFARALQPVATTKGQLADPKPL